MNISLDILFLFVYLLFLFVYLLFLFVYLLFLHNGTMSISFTIYVTARLGQHAFGIKNIFCNYSAKLLL